MTHSPPRPLGRPQQCRAGLMSLGLLPERKFDYAAALVRTYLAVVRVLVGGTFFEDYCHETRLLPFSHPRCAGLCRHGRVTVGLHDASESPPSHQYRGGETMNKETFEETMLWLEGELRRDGLSLSQIETIEADAMLITQGEFAETPAQYIVTVNRLANSGLY